MTETTTPAADGSLIIERIEQELGERQASDARLQALLGDLHGAFKAALKIGQGTAHG
ncbi:hypothetical protein SOQ14_07100 [Erythrobacter sp. T5W1-R]|uniref:hypothetical protein n=1 Tax=Erythrobacter sp. T5W1-R TaxID=3101752 RepID=UPI002AFFC8B7|nr:hypothetical protein [Erythrobacter sp. T5W1-R]MEA1618681.1 hypothetical protein [Erythrobacter sp. T5W1-R]